MNRMTEAAGIAALTENDYYMRNVQTIVENRQWTARQLESLGFTVVPSKTNFVFARSEKIDGAKLYTELKKRGVLVRHFANPRTAQYVRITIGTMEQMEILLNTVKEILEA